MKKIFGVMLLASAILTSSNAIADSDKRSSGRDGVQCIDGGERECGIAWEGRSLFKIDARAKTIINDITNYNFIAYEEDLDLQMAYLCCTGDETRRNICDQTHYWVNPAHCTDYVGKFFHSDGMTATYEKIKDLASFDFSPEVWPTWGKRVRDMTNDIASRNRSGSARTMQECMNGAVEYGVSLYDITIGEYEAETCIAAIFDTLRDESECLWNNAGGAFCDE
jgi:hypothetical protein